MTSNEENKVDILNNINDQFKELIELIEKEKSYSFSMKRFNQLLRDRTQSKKSRLIIIISCLLFIFILTYIILSNENISYNIYFVFLSIVRIALIQILPFWNWTNIYTSQCLIANPFYHNSLALSECNRCLNTTEVSRQSNVTFFNFTKTIYYKHLPVVIDDATQDWSAMKELTVKNLFQLFLADPVLAENDLCYFESNIRQYNKPGGADLLFDDYLTGKRRSFIAHWNNCKRETIKTIRSYYSKPYFLPPSVSQTLMGNWLLVSAGLHKDVKRYHRIPLNHNWAWVAQIQGSSLIELRPKYPCDQRCSILKSITLNSGDLIIYSYLYDAFYSPLKKETILLGQGVD